MDGNKDSTQVERLDVVETGRRRRWSDDEQLRIVIESLQGATHNIIHSEAPPHIADVADGMAAFVPAGAK